MITQSQRTYNSNLLLLNIQYLIKNYNFLTYEIIGYSVLGKAIYCLKLGTGRKEVFYTASIHANESINTNLFMRFVENMCISYEKKDSIYGYNIYDLLQNVSIFIVPMVNPDGVDLVNDAIDKNSNSYIKAKKIASNYPNISFPNGWKANINGVDLNLQFPAGWKNAKSIKYSQGYASPAPRDFVGYGPLEEPEALAIYNFTLSHNFNLILTYHTQGQEIYWQFENYAPANAYTIGLEFAKLSGYTLADVPYQSSFAGYKDWFLQEYKRPGYTIETGLGENPIPLSQFDEIYNNNIGILVSGAT